MNEQASSEINFSRNQLDKFCEIIRKNTGFLLDQPKFRSRIKNKIRGRMEKLNLDSPEEYYDYIWNSTDQNEEIQSLINDCLVNETLFFRYSHQLRMLKEDVFPKLIQLRQEKRNDPIRVLSAGCSTGAEPFSLVMAYFEACNESSNNPEKPDIEVLGVDLSQEALNKARKSVYRERVVKNAPQAVVDKYFEAMKDSKRYKVVDSVRNRVNFKHLNLKKYSPPADRELVLFRNVMMYLDSSTRETVIEKLHTSLKSDGYILVSPSESLKDYPEYFVKSDDHEHELYRSWSTNERVASTPESSSRQNASNFESEEIENESQIESKLSLGGETQTLLLKGTFSKNIDTEDFLNQLMFHLTPDKKHYVVDLLEMDFISNHHLRSLREAFEAMDDSSRDIHLVTTDDTLKKWAKRCINNSFLKITKSLPEDNSNSDTSYTDSDNRENNNPASNQSSTKNKKNNNSESSRSKTSKRTNNSESSDSSFDSDNRLSANKQSDEEKIEIQQLPKSIELSLNGNFGAEESPGSIEKLKDYLSETLDELSNKGRDSKSSIVVNLKNVNYFDRSIADIFKRFRRLSENENFKFEVNCSDTLESNLSRWGFDV